MFTQIDFSSVWDGVTTILPSISDVMAIGAGFWAAGLLLKTIRNFLGVKKSNMEEDEK